MKTKTTERDLLKMLDIDALTPEQQEELLLDMNELVYRGTMMRLLNMMDEKTKEDFEKLLDADAEETEIEAFLEERVPGSDQAVEDTIKEMRNDILAVTGESQD